MKKNLKLSLIVILSMFMLLLAGCKSNTSTDNTTTDKTTTDKTTTDNSSTTTDKKAPTNEEYYQYLTDEYNKYLGNSALYADYDIYAEDFTYDGTYEEFITTYSGDYDELKANLQSFKSDLENNVVKGNAEVDKVNADVITALDKAIIAVDDYTGTFGEKTKDYATLSKDEVIKGLRTLATGPHEAKVELDNLIQSAKTNLKIS